MVKQITKCYSSTWCIYAPPRPSSSATYILLLLVLVSIQYSVFDVAAMSPLNGCLRLHKTNMVRRRGGEKHIATPSRENCSPGSLFDSRREGNTYIRVYVRWSVICAPRGCFAFVLSLKHCLGTLTEHPKEAWYWCYSSLDRRARRCAFPHAPGTLCDL